MLLTEKSPPQKSASLCSTIGRELSLIYLIHSNNVLSLENPVGYLKAQYPALDDVAVDFANSSTFLLFNNERQRTFFHFCALSFSLKKIDFITIRIKIKG